MIIDDSTPMNAIAEPADCSRGLDISLRGDGDFGSSAESFPRDLIIPQSEWQGIIEEMDERKSRLSDLSAQAGRKVKYQLKTNYCWAFGSVSCVEVRRIAQGEQHVSLSPASVGAQVKGYRNQGGWGREAIQFIAEHGVAPTSLWPDAAIDSRYATPEAKQAASKRCVTAWWKLRPRTMDEVVSCLIRRWPIAAGLLWWEHLVMFLDPVWVNGAVGVRFENSWSENWGDKGFGILQGERMLPDDAVAPREVMVG